MNAKKEILSLTENEEILAISIGEKGWGDRPEGETYFSGKNINTALDILDFEFDDGFGGEEGYNLYVWTKNWIIIKSCYDGSENYCKVPRNPNKEILPESFGGG